MSDININLSHAVTLSCSDSVTHPLMVCSHERSGTHFLMNAINECTKYTSKPFINFDLIPLGGSLNFFHDQSVCDFYRKISNFRIDGKTNCARNISKSHFPVSLVGKALKNDLKLFYIYRNPVDVMISYWKFLHQWDWFEGPKTSSPLELAKHIPAGQSQRYQLRNCTSYFVRWAEHVSNAFIAAKNNANIVLVRYNDLKCDYKRTVLESCHSLKLEIINDPIPPSKNDFIKGANMKLSQKAVDELFDYCSEQLSKFEALPLNVLKA